MTVIFYKALCQRTRLANMYCVQQSIAQQLFITYNAKNIAIQLQATLMVLSTSGKDTHCSHNLQKREKYNSIDKRYKYC